MGYRKVVIKPYLTFEQIKAIETLQRVDIGLFEAKLNYEQIEELLCSRYQRMKLKLAI